jgi:hypothetical protein
MHGPSGDKSPVPRHRGKCARPDKSVLQITKLSIYKLDHKKCGSDPRPQLAEYANPRVIFWTKRQIPDSGTSAPALGEILFYRPNFKIHEQERENSRSTFETTCKPLIAFARHDESFSKTPRKFTKKLSQRRSVRACLAGRLVF